MTEYKLVVVGGKHFLHNDNVLVVGTIDSRSSISIVPIQTLDLILGD